MAAPGRVGSRAAQHEERAGSLESVPTACPAALERPAEPPGRTLWEQICEGRRRRGARAGPGRAAGVIDARGPLAAAPLTRGAPVYTPETGLEGLLMIMRRGRQPPSAVGGKCGAEWGKQCNGQAVWTRVLEPIQ